MCCSSLAITTCSVYIEQVFTRGQQYANGMQVEALVGRADISTISLGDSHTLFLDRLGAMWSCGDNKDGQCGLQATLQLLAGQQHGHHQPASRHMQAFRGLPVQVRHAATW